MVYIKLFKLPNVGTWFGNRGRKIRKIKVMPQVLIGIVIWTLAHLIDYSHENEFIFGIHILSNNCYVFSTKKKK